MDMDDLPGTCFCTSSTAGTFFLVYLGNAVFIHGNGTVGTGVDAQTAGYTAIGTGGITISFMTSAVAGNKCRVIGKFFLCCHSTTSFHKVYFSVGAHTVSHDRNGNKHRQWPVQLG